MNAEENQKLQEAERRRREWQPPNVDSSDGDTDDELARDEDLRLGKPTERRTNKLIII